ncbi:hypothetical protein E4U41_005594 [Claviceps citrina]|nr:hypothetical protein E4U41_005594 [Claviceps citrina]
MIRLDGRLGRKSKGKERWTAPYDVGRRTSLSGQTGVANSSSLAAQPALPTARSSTPRTWMLRPLQMFSRTSWRVFLAGAPSFSLEPDGKIAFDAPQGFRVRIDIIQIGGGCIDTIYATEPFYEASVASKSDLLRLRAVTVVERGSDGEVDDFRWLLSEVAREGQVLPELNEQDLKYVTGAAAFLGQLDLLIW